MDTMLLPFTENIDARAIEYAIILAKHGDARLLVVSYLAVSSDARGRDIYPRLGAIEQSKDFLTTVQYRAQECGVKTAIMEFYCRDIATSIQQLAREYCCTSVLVFVRNGRPVLLSPAVIRRLLTDDRVPLFMVSLAQQRPFGSRLKDWLDYFLHWHHRSVIIDKKDVSMKETSKDEPQRLAR